MKQALPWNYFCPFYSVYFSWYCFFNVWCQHLLEIWRWGGRNGWFGRWRWCSSIRLFHNQSFLIDGESWFCVCTHFSIQVSVPPESNNNGAELKVMYIRINNSILLLFTCDLILSFNEDNGGEILSSEFCIFQSYILQGFALCN